LPWRGRCNGSTSGPNKNADSQAAKPLDRLPERGMLALGGIQVGKHHHRQALAGRLERERIQAAARRYVREQAPTPPVAVLGAC
jgi:hypothetical protein